MPATPIPATEKQTALLAKLVESKDLPEGFKLPETVTKHSASVLIDLLMSRPRKPLAEAEKAAPGYYVRDSEVFVVVISGTGNPYAKRMVITGNRGRWEYAPGVGRTLADLTPLTVAEAVKLGRAHGVCMICGRTLSDVESVERGIGPVCARKLPV